MPQGLIAGLRRFRAETFPHLEARYRELVENGQNPSALFIGCCDSRVVPALLVDAQPGELFVVRNLGAMVPAADSADYGDATAAAIESGVVLLGVTDIIVCGHSHCGAIAGLYARPRADTPHLQRWLELGAEARVAGAPAEPDRDLLLRTEQRSIAIQLARLMTYAAVRERVEDGRLSLHGWYYVIEAGQVLEMDIDREGFVPLGEAPPPRA